MNVKKILCVVLSYVMISTLFSSCSKVTTSTVKTSVATSSTATSSTATSSMATSSMATSSAATSSVSTSSVAKSSAATSSVAKSSTSTSSLSAIIDSLKKDKTVTEYAVSHDSKKIAVIDWNPDIYIITVANGSRTKVTDIDHDTENALHTLLWSYDDKYFSVENCTDVIGETLVYNASTLLKRLTINYDMGEVWSYSSDVIAFSVVSDKVNLSFQGDEVTNSTDVVVYNMDTLNNRIVLSADPKFFYDTLTWDKTGLSVNKEYLPSNKNETVTLNISQ